MKRRRVWAIGLLLIVAALIVVWQWQRHGRAVQDGRAAQDNAAILRAPHPPFKRLWRFDLKEQLESFVVAGNVLFYGTFQSYGALDLNTGRALWQRPFLKRYFSAEVAFDDDDRVLYVALGSKLKLLACDPRTGRELWSLPMKGSYTHIAVRQGTIFCGTEDSVLVALDCKTRKEKWRTSIRPVSQAKGKRLDLDLSAAPLISGGKLFVCTALPEVLCLNKETGAILWRRAIGERDSCGAYG